MIGTESGVCALSCDLCGRAATGGIFTGQKAVDNYIKKNGWVHITTDKGFDKEICSVCVEKIMQTQDGGNDGE